jgi:hypothetical protein
MRIVGDVHKIIPYIQQGTVPGRTGTREIVEKIGFDWIIPIAGAVLPKFPKKCKERELAILFTVKRSFGDPHRCPEEQLLIGADLCDDEIR